MNIKRWLNQKYIGDQLERGQALFMVTEGEVEMESGERRTVWVLTPPPTPFWVSNTDGSRSQLFRPHWGETTFEKPRIDRLMEGNQEAKGQ